MRTQRLCVTCICVATETVSGIPLNMKELLGNKSLSMWCFFSTRGEEANHDEN